MGVLPIDPASFKKWYERNSRSLLILIAASCLCAAALFQFISVFASTSLGAYREIFYELGLSGIFDTFDTVRVIIILFTIVGLAPNILKIIGFFFQWFKEFNGAMNRKRTGITLIKVSAIISLVYSCIVTLVAEIVLIILMVVASEAASYYSGASAGVGILVLIMLIVAGCEVVTFMYYLKMLKICAAVNDGIDGHPHTFQGGMFVIVMLGIIAFFAFISSLFSGVLGIFAGLFMLGYQVLILLCLASLREDFNRMANGMEPVNRFAMNSGQSGMGGAVGGGIGVGTVRVLDGTQRQLQIQQGMVLNVGKDPSKSQLTVDSVFASVSGMHVSIMYMGQAGYYVTDVSTNGTFLQNGARLQKGVQTQLPRQSVLILANQCRVMLM